MAEMKVDIDPFELSLNYVQPVSLSVNMVRVEKEQMGENDKMMIDMDLDMFEDIEKPIFPKAGEDLLDFLLKQKESGENVALYPRCSAVFDQTATKTYEKQKEKIVGDKTVKAIGSQAADKVKVGKGVEDVKAQKSTTKDVPASSNTKKVKLNPIKQKMKTVVMVGGRPEGIQSKIRVPPTQVMQNKWLQNTCTKGIFHVHTCNSPNSHNSFNAYIISLWVGISRHLMHQIILCNIDLTRSWLL